MRKDKKIVLIAVVTLFVLFVAAVVLILSLGAANIRELCELELPKVEAYLENKYNEDMEIYDYSYYDDVIVHVKLKENENINFSVVNWRGSGTYYDDFLEQYLRNEIEEAVKEKLYTEKIAIKEVSVSSTTAPPLECAEKLYQCYKKVGLKSFYEEALNVISLEYISVYVDKKIYETEKTRIHGIVQKMGYPIDTIHVKKD